LDARLIPWLGVWKQQAPDNRNGPAKAAADSPSLCVFAGPDGRGLVVSVCGQESAAVQETVLADGSPHSVAKMGCDGWRKARWSADGNRIFTNSELDCTGSGHRSISGMMLIAPGGIWTDIQLVQTGEKRSVWIQRYRYQGATPGTNATAANLAASTMDRVLARSSASASWSMDDVLEAQQEVEPEVLEAALVESRSRFNVNSRLLLRLAEAGTPQHVIDLIVALSFPGKFVIERGVISEVQRASQLRAAGAAIYPAGWSFGWCYPWYYGYLPYYGYALGYYGLYYPWYYSSPGYWWPPSGGVQPPSGGLVVAGRGYTRIRERDDASGYARSRRGGWSGGSGSYGGAGASGSSGGGSSGGSSGGGPGASPSGYSSGGASSGQAHPRP
jgi:hypothetical protein